MSESFFLPDAEEKGHPTLRTNVHAMVDLETFGTGPTSAIISIGACLFDPNGTDSVESMMGRSFMRRVSIADTLKYGDVDPETIAWWFTQDQEAIHNLVGEDTVGLNTALMNFRQFCTTRTPKVSEQFFMGHADLPLACALWAKGPDFDCKILEHACRQVNEGMPINFHDYRCVRTVQDLGFPDPEDRPEFEGVKHDPRADAVNQALTVQAAYKVLGITDGVVYDTY